MNGGKLPENRSLFPACLGLVPLAVPAYCDIIMVLEEVGKMPAKIARRAGAIFTLDAQSDIWQGRYKLIERTAPNTWTVEYLPDPPETVERIRRYWAEDATSTDPVWDKTWAECDKSAGEHPRIIGRRTREQMAEEELANRAARAGRRSTVKFISSKRWHEYF